MVKRLEKFLIKIGEKKMNYESAKAKCHNRSAIYRESKQVRYYKNHPILHLHKS